MSLIGKKPFVQEIFSAMSGEQLLRLNTLVNNLGEPEFVEFDKIGQANMGVSYVRLTFNELYMNSHFGFLIYVDDEHCGFFSFQDYFEEMKSVKIDPVSHQYWYLQEHLSAEEFRRALDDAMEAVVPEGTITAANIDSESSASGQVLTSDGVGGASWQSLSNEVTVSDINSEEAEAGKVIVSNGEGGAVWGDSSAGLPEATKANQALVTNDELEAEWSKSVPLADNLLSEPITNDAPYTYGPTGGSADIATGEEAYLQEVKGMSIVWNQLYDGQHMVYCKSGHIYIRFRGAGYAPAWELIQPQNNTTSYSSIIFDLTLMFGGNDKIPFSLANDIVEYPVNGNIPEQKPTAVQRFQRLFANVDLYNAPYDAGTIKNVKVNKLVETGRNLWDASTMASSGLKLIAGYKYEVYVEGGFVDYSKTGLPNSWSPIAASPYTSASGTAIRVIQATDTGHIRTYNGGTIKYVGFVHSGNYCLGTSGTYPAYHKYEFDISGLSENGLNGLKSNSTTGSTFEVYDTKDYTRVGSIDLSTLHDYMTWDSEYGWALDTTHIPNYMEALESGTSIGELGCLLTQQYMTFDGDPAEHILYLNNGDSTNKPTGTMLYPLATPVATGESAFEPIPLKVGDNWIVDDMGSEYFEGVNVCPVNQVAYYYENLKDKLVNMQEPIEIAAASYDKGYTPLESLKIGNNIYRLLRLGSNSNNSGIAIGYNSASSGYSVALGQGSNAGGGNSTALGRLATVSGANSVGIGTSTACTPENCVCFDAMNSDGRTFLIQDPEHIFFRFVVNDVNKATLRTYFAARRLSHYIQNQPLTLQDGKWYINYTNATDYITFTKDASAFYGEMDTSSSFTGVRLIVKLSNNVVASLDLLPYDSTSSQAFTAYGIGDSSGHLISAYIDSDGTVVIDTSATGATISEVKYNLR